MSFYKNIENYSPYQINTNGIVRRIFPNRISYLKPALSGDGYLAVSICNKNCYIHRLVALTFIPNPENKRCVNHINGIKTDNRVENLEWMTQKENIHHARDVLKKYYNNKNNRYTDKNEKREKMKLTEKQSKQLKTKLAMQGSGSKKKTIRKVGM